MIEQLINKLRQKGSPCVHLGMSLFNEQAFGFYSKLGFMELVRAGSGNDQCIYMGKHLRAS